jgi:UDP-N-acetyl-D-glucosamine dehydrogenase
VVDRLHPMAPPPRLLIKSSAVLTDPSPSSVDLVVVGLGYVGLRLLREAHRAGLRVAGHDVSPTVVGGLKLGISHIDDVTDSDVRSLIDDGVAVTAEPDVLGRAEIVVMCVPTPLDSDRRPDLGAVRAATRTTAAHLRPGMLVVLESTTFPGTTEDVVRPLLESGSHLVAGEDFHLAYSPERVDPGNTTYGIVQTPKVVGGLTPACSIRAATFYRRFVHQVVIARSSREAEMAKLLENAYRNVNIALVNELAMLCHKMRIDVWDVIECAATKPFGFQPFWPGPGVGGHCIPIDPSYLTHAARTAGVSLRLIEAAQDINRDMAEYIVIRAMDALNARQKPLNGATVLLLGITYKADVADLRETPAVPIARRLRAQGAKVIYHDPHVPHWKPDGEHVERVTELTDALSSADLTVLLQRHRDYDPHLLAGTARLLLDTRGTVRGDTVEGL